MEPLSLPQVLTALRGSMNGRCDLSEFTGVSTDTRTIEQGDLFFALKGPHFDGHKYVALAREKGARGAVVSDHVEGVKSESDFAVIRVADSGKALMDLARFYRSQFSAKVIAITGSNGKTTTKEILGTILEEFAPTIRSKKSFNNRIGLPLTLFEIDRDTQYAVVEIGTSAPGEIAELAEVARPDISVITNIAASHLEGLGDIEGVCQEKATLLESMSADGLSILNIDDAHFDALKAKARGAVITFGFMGKAADYKATQVECELNSIRFKIGAQPRVDVPLTGCHNVSNVLAALAVSGELQLSPARVRNALANLVGPPGRMRPLITDDVLILDDSYNANPGSVMAALNTFSILGVTGRKVLVLGDMCELGIHSESFHREIGRLLYAGRFDCLIAVGKESRFLVHEAMNRGFFADDIDHFETAEEAAAFLPSLIRVGDTILVKGSRAIGLDKVVNVIQHAELAPCWSGAEHETRGVLKMRA